MLDKFKDKRILLGLFFTVASAVASFALSWVFFLSAETLSRMGEHLYDCGIDVMGAFVCAALYYGSMRQDGKGAGAFSALIALVSAGFLVNALMFFTGLVLEQRVLNFVFIMLSKLIDLVMIYLFYRYIRVSLDFKGKLVGLADKGIPILMAIQMLVVVVNVFYPVTFWVDENMMYHATEFAAAEDVYLIVASVILTILIIRSESLRNQKIAALTFIFLPLFIYLLNYGEFGNASNYGMILMSLVIMYCVIFNYNSSKLVSTQDELNTAAEIQAGMLPSAPPSGEAFELHAIMNTAKEVGGDFYDYFMIDEDHLCIVIADVCDKGMPAALFMMRGTTVIRDNAFVRGTTSEILTAANARLCENNAETMFVTAWIGVLDIRTMTLQFTNAGHDYPILQHKDRSCEALKETHGMVLGGFSFSKYRHSEIKLEPGDRLLLFTDGVIEAHDATDGLYGMERLEEVLKDNRECSGDQVLAKIIDDIGVFSKGVPQFDDITMVVLTIND